MDQELIDKLEELVSRGDYIIAIGHMNGADLQMFWKTSNFPTDNMKQFVVELSKQLKKHKTDIESDLISADSDETQ